MRDKDSEKCVVLDGGPLTPGEVACVARDGQWVELGAKGAANLERAAKRLGGALGAGTALYGVNTGFGSLSRKRIGDDDLKEVQRNLLRSHAACVGNEQAEEVTRGMMLILAASLSRGHSGVRAEVVRAIVGLLNSGATPVVPETGSVGASGDLAPLAHACLVLIGEGEARLDGRIVSGAEAMSAAGISPVVLGPKEGLALINGTHLMAAHGALLMDDVDGLMSAALAACAMSMDAAKCTDAFLDPRVHEIRQQRGQQRIAERLRALLVGSEILPSHVDDDPRVQDPYSFRCMPAVGGAALDLIEHVRGRVCAELGAVTDNPLVFEEKDGERSIVSAGNFHGMPIALPLDCLPMAFAHLAGISERRVFHLLSATDPEAGLTPHLSPTPGLHSGLMITQYTAAACCNEIVTLCAPATVVNISTCAGMEDYNSFGPRAAGQARAAMELCRRVVSIELLCASEALERQRPLKSGRGVEAAHGLVRRVSPVLVADRPPSPDIEAIAGLILGNEFAICETA